MTYGKIAVSYVRKEFYATAPPGLVVMGGDLFLRGFEFESNHRKIHFSRLFAAKMFSFRV